MIIKKIKKTPFLSEREVRKFIDNPRECLGVFNFGSRIGTAEVWVIERNNESHLAAIFLEMYSEDEPAHNRFGEPVIDDVVFDWNIPNKRDLHYCRYKAIKKITIEQLRNIGLESFIIDEPEMIEIYEDYLDFDWNPFDDYDGYDDDYDEPEPAEKKTILYMRTHDLDCIKKTRKGFLDKLNEYCSEHMIFETYCFWNITGYYEEIVKLLEEYDIPYVSELEKEKKKR